ncbi:lactate utilization protein B [Streptomyces sp. NPDC006984]|uniref:lactate utilization protein B n=1 Tax=Streptomyces sp. NPDC006984 TaxID=3155463 RepID=UPI0033E519E5
MTRPNRPGGAVGSGDDLPESPLAGTPAPPPHAPPGTGRLRGDTPFPRAARVALADGTLRGNLRRATGTIRARRLAATGELPDWEQLRDAGAALKSEALDRLPELLLQLEAAFTERGGTVHWARDAAEANAIVTRLVRETGSEEVVKVKSMATQEIGLNEHLARQGITAHETDLAELIVQLAGDRPSHILVPAIHRNREEIRGILRDGIPDADPRLGSDPAELAAAARAHLRERFLTVPVAVSGANFGIAETGTLCVVESEGNGRMCLILPRTLITVMGLEKVVPLHRDLEVFLQLLPRSATGERMNPYTSLWTGVTPGDGPREVHLVLLDNGRTAALADPLGRGALGCIRCSACLNVCPVYEQVGGHAYGSTYPGPIGAVLSPYLAGMHATRDDPNRTLPYASTLCGACLDACPVRIDLPAMLVDLRRRHTEEAGRTPEALAMRTAGAVMRRPRLYTAAQRTAARLARAAARRDGRITRLPPPLAGWTEARDAPVPAQEAFRSWFASPEGAAAMRAAAHEGERRRAAHGGPGGGDLAHGHDRPGGGDPAHGHDRREEER